MSTIKSKQLEGVKANQLLSNNITAVTDPTAAQDISQGYFPSSVWVNTAASPKKVFICSDNSLGSAVWNQVNPSNAQTVIQTLHGFTVGQVLKHSGGSYALAQADTQANIGIWIVSKVIDANTFQIIQEGYITGLSGGTADETWYLSDTTAGGLVNVAPAIAQPIIYWITASEGWVLGYPATSSGVIPSGAAPNGYNKLSVTFTGNTVTYEGDTVLQGQSYGLNNSVIVSGAAGWRYGVIDTSGNASHEVIPVAEIIADTQQYTPAPPFDSAWNGYYSSVNPTKRICWILYFDGTNILEAIPYGSGKNKNDNFWASVGNGITQASNGYRMQFTDPFEYTRGDGLICVDNGFGNSDNEGFRITSVRSGKLTFSFQFLNQNNIGDASIGVNKNGSSWINLIGQSTTPSFSSYFNYTFSEPVQAGDYFTFPFSVTVNGTMTINRVRAVLEEI